MRTFDLAPLYRSTVGFDRLFSLFDQARPDTTSALAGYPPYNIERTGENAYRITVAVAGFAEPELSIVAKENTLTIRGEKQSQDRATGRGALSGYRRARLRARVPARRPCRGQGRAAWRTGSCTSTSCARFPRR